MSAEISEQCHVCERSIDKDGPRPGKLIPVSPVDEIKVCNDCRSHDFDWLTTHNKSCNKCGENSLTIECGGKAKLTSSTAASMVTSGSAGTRYPEPRLHTEVTSDESRLSL